MENLIEQTGFVLIGAIIILALWDAVWKLIAMWHAAQKKQLAWYICIAVFNTIGILPIIYLVLNKRKKNLKDEDY